MGGTPHLCNISFIKKDFFSRLLKGTKEFTDHKKEGGFPKSHVLEKKTG